jgi:hypothetical protein
VSRRTQRSRQRIICSPSRQAPSQVRRLQRRSLRSLHQRSSSILLKASQHLKVSTRHQATGLQLKELPPDSSSTPHNTVRRPKASTLRKDNIRRKDMALHPKASIHPSTGLHRLKANTHRSTAHRNRERTQEPPRVILATEADQASQRSMQTRSVVDAGLFLGIISKNMYVRTGLQREEYR